MATSVDELITVREAARACRRTPETVRRWIWDGKLPAQKLGKQLFVRRADLGPWLPKDAERERAQRLAALEAIRAIRERVRERTGGTFDVVALLDEDRAAHP